MTTELAHGSIKIDVNDKEAIAALRKVDAEFEKTMKDIDRQAATVDIKGNLRDLEDAVKNAKREIRKLEGVRADLEIGAQSEELDAEIKKARIKLKQLDGEKATVELQFKSDDAAYKIAQARIKAIQDAQKRQAAAEKKQAAEHLARVNMAARVSKSLHDQQMREEKAAQKLNDANVNLRARQMKSLADQRSREMNAAERDAHRIETARQRELDSIPKLRQQYAELAKSIDKMNAGRRKIRDEKLKIIADLQVDAALAKMKILHTTLERLGSPVDLDVKLNPGRDFGSTLRLAMMGGRGGGIAGARHAARDIGTILGIEVGAGARSALTKALSPRNLLTALGNIGSRVTHALSGLSDMTVRLGPFTATIRQAVVGMSLLAPIILDVVGALGSLISVTGSGLVGALGVATGAAGAFGLVLGSTGLLLPSLMRDFKSLTTIQNAYHTAVLKYGAGSDKAKEKLKQFNQALVGATPSAKKAFMSFDKLQQSWRDLSKASRPAFLDAFGEAIKTASSSIKTFGPEVTQSFKLVADGVGRLMKDLRGSTARGIIQELFDNGQKALPAFQRALGNLGHAAANVATAFSRMLPSLGGGFETWTRNILKFTENTTKMNKLVRQSTDSLRSFGHFAQAASHFLTTFFGGGITAGQGFLDTMTKALDRWTAFLQTAHGNSNLQRFFSEGVKGSQAFFATLGPVVASFVTWAESIAPFARDFFQAASAVSSFVAALLRVTGLRTPLAALATTLGFLWGIGKISSAITAISGFTRALLGMAAAERTVAVSTEAANAARGVQAAESLLPMGGVGRAAKGVGLAEGAIGAERAAVGVSKLGRAGGFAAGAMRILGGAVTGFSTVGAGLGVLAVGAAAGMYLWANRTRTFEKATKDANAAMAAQLQLTQQVRDQNLNLAQGTLSLAQSRRDVTAASRQSAQEEDKLNKLRDAGKKNTSEYRQLEDQHKATLLQLAAATDQVKSSELALKKGRDDQKKAIEAELKLADDQVAKRKKAYDDLAKNNVGKLYATIEKNARAAGKSVKDYLNQDYSNTGTSKDRLLKFGEALDSLRQAQRNVTSTSREVGLQLLNLGRTARGLGPIAGTLARTFSTIRGLGGKRLTTDVAFKFPDPSEAARVAAAVSRALQAGVKPAKLRFIVENSKDAESALRRINGIKIGPKGVTVGSDQIRSAIALLSKVQITRLSPKMVEVKAIDHASATLDLYRGTRTIGTAIVNVFQKAINKVAAKTKAAGDGAWGTETPGTRLLQARALGASARGMLPRSTSAARGMKVSGPREIWGEEPQHPEFVISTNPAYRASNASFLKQAAAHLGVKMAAVGKAKNPALSSRGAQIARGEARKQVPKHRTYSSDNVVELADVEKAKQREENYARQIGINEGRLKEPDTFLKVVGTDPATGDPIYDIDQNAITNWTKSLEDIAAQYDKLAKLIQQTEQAVHAAMKRLGTPSKKAGAGGIIGRTYSNIKVLTKLIDKEDGIIGSKSSNKADVQAAKERKRVYEDAINAEQDTRKNATADWELMDQDRTDAGFRLQEANNNASDLRDQEQAVAGKASADLKSSNPPDAGPGALASPVDVAQGAVDSLSAEGALAAIGQGFNGAPPRPQSAINTDLINANQNIINAATGLLHDADPTNDSAALSAIQSAAGAIQQLQQPPDVSANLQAQLDQSNAINLGLQQNAALNAQILSTFQGFSDQGSAPNIVINTLHPGDPSVLRAIGDAATAGQSFQPLITSPRTSANV